MNDFEKEEVNSTQSDNFAETENSVENQESDEKEIVVQAEPDELETTETENQNFFAGARSFEFDREQEKKFEKSSLRFWKTLGIISLAAVMAFSGAFFGMIWVCQTSVLGGSEFFRSIIVANSGVTLNRVDIDYISGEYQPTDSITLAEKVRKCTVSIQAIVYDEETGEFSDPSNGSGVILSYDEKTGYAMIVTNQHVAYGSNYFNIIMHDGVSYVGELLHLDQVSDLALIRIKTNEEVPTATVSDSSKLVYGQEIIAVGNPLGYESSLSYGHISCPERYLSSENSSFIQIDASVNPGNSGGGLYDSQGNLIGIIVSKASGSNVDGIGFAIPSNTMIETVNDLLNFGYVKGRPALGITVSTVNVSSWDFFNEGDLAGMLEPYNYGVYVISSKYYPDKIFKGDKITSIYGKNLSEPLEITSKEQISQVILKHEVGDTLTLNIQRGTKKADGTFTFKELTVNIVLRERDWADENYIA